MNGDVRRRTRAAGGRGEAGTRSEVDGHASALRHQHLQGAGLSVKRRAGVQMGLFTWNGPEILRLQAHSVIPGTF